MIILYIAWIVVGAAAGALVNTLFRGGNLELFARTTIAAFGAVAGGWLANFAGFEPGGQIIGPILAAGIGAFAALIGMFVYSQS